MALLDTSVLLAAVIAPERLPEAVQSLLQDRANTVYFSAACLWEVAIKRSLNRNDFDFQSEDIEQLARETGFTELPLRFKPCHAVSRMPWHHRDPFDRLLVAHQAWSLPARLLTTGPAVGAVFRAGVVRFAALREFRFCPESIESDRWVLLRWVNSDFKCNSRRLSDRDLVVERVNNVVCRDGRFYAFDRGRLNGDPIDRD